jgi:AP-4 complex subunit beta-1
MISDIDGSVTTNVLMVLEELKLAEGGIEPTSELIMHLLNRLGEFNEWGLNVVLDILSRYCPKSEDETFAIMNILDPVLRTSNSGAVLATIKCFFSLTEPYPEFTIQVIQRSKAPLLTLLASSSSEIQYAVLKHLELLLQKSNSHGIFDDEYKQFFVRYNEPPHVKHLKVELIRYICNSNNAREIATELGEYVTDVDSELSKRAIRALGEIALRVSEVSSEMTQRVVELVDLDMSYVRSEALIVLGNVVRIFPSMRIHILPFISRYLKGVEDSEARAVLIWLLGEYGEEVIESPYLLEPIIDDYEEETSTTVKLHTLSAAMKLFFKRPPEMQAMLGRLLSSAVNDTANQDVHDRALLYYRLLSTNVDKTEQIFKRHTDDSNSHNIHAPDGDSDLETLEQVYREFNTLSVIYGKPCAHFIDAKYLLVSHSDQLIFFKSDSLFSLASSPTSLCFPRYLTEYFRVR